MMNEEDLKDFDLSTFDTSVSQYIKASAGTGKTYTIQLIVAELVKKGTPLKKILIVTYTDKAAGELKDRIRKKIHEVLETKRISDKDSAELSNEELQLFAKASQDVDNAAIFTIHSFCQKTLKEYAYDAGRPFDVNLVDDEKATELIEKFIRDKWVNNEEFKFLLQEKDAGSFIKELQNYFVNAINRYKGSHITPLDEITSPLENYEVSLDFCKKILEAKNYDDLKILFPSLNERLDKFDEAGNRPNIETTASKKNTFQNKLDRCLNFAKEVRSWTPNKSLYNGKNFRKEWFFDDLREDFSFIAGINSFLKGAIHLLTIKFVNDQIPDVFIEWQKVKNERKQQSYNDMILAVHQAVLGGNSLKYKLRNQYQFAIIDEFQDTNKMQWDIFSNVFLKKDAENQAFNHSIFVVGDPKQSIYSFQGADVNVYQEAIKEIGTGSSLAVNYRSTKGIIDGCNLLFEGDFFKATNDNCESIVFKESGSPIDPKNTKAAPKINNQECSSIWLSEEMISPVDFAKTAVEKIVDWCTKENGTSKLQVFDKRNPQQLRNVSFKDFAVLARSRAEMLVFEHELRKAGVPFGRYKDDKLFCSRECAEWISLFKALNAPDFSAWNRRLLSEVLLTDFFKINIAADESNEKSDHLEQLHYVESDEFDDPNKIERRQLNTWRSLAIKHRYAEMLECIYNDTQIEQHLMDVSSLQDLAKLRQIGNYAIDYLYNNNCSLDDLIRHLEGLANWTEGTEDNDGNLVEKGSDYDAVQIMTIHASKGLEFPVVISIAGSCVPKSNDKGPFIYHDEGGIHLGLSEEAKNARKAEERDELKRLFYVDFTRASSILMIPRYESWFSDPKKAKDKDDKIYSFLQKSIENFITKADKNSYSILKTNNSWDTASIQNQIKTKILNENSSCNGSEVTTPEMTAEQIDTQKETMRHLQSQIGGLSVMQYSYSNLSGGSDSEITGDNDTDPDVNRAAKKRITKVDTKATNCTIQVDPANCITGLGEEAEGFPRGNKVGNALHHVFERLTFCEYKSIDSDEEKQRSLEEIIQEEFMAESLPIWKHQDSWTKIAMSYVCNTLGAQLPTIKGCKPTGKRFSLTDIPAGCHKPEVQFNLNATKKESHISDYLRRFCKGFMDLLFVMTDDEGNKVYSILDWKSDKLDENAYTPGAIKKKVDEEYSVQRVLYSYCLIQWLKQFYGEGTEKNLTEEEIFKKHFGGIYYVFLRGTRAGEGNGIYAQTWDSFETLKEAFGNVEGLMNKRK